MPEQITNLTNTLWVGLTSGFTSFMNFVPALFGAIIILVAGWFVSKIMGKIVERVLTAIKFEGVVEKTNISDYLPQTKPGVKPKLSTFIGTMAKWFTFLIFVQAAAIVLGVAQLTGIISSVILFIPNIVVAIAILVGGAWAARFVGGLVEASAVKMNLGKPKVLALLARNGIFGFAMIAAISQLGIAVHLINILFTGLVGFLALAFGLAFGLGGQGVAADITRSWFDRSRSTDGMPTSSKIDKPEAEISSIHH